MPNVYDCDNTILYANAGAAFYCFCAGRHPGLLRYLPCIAKELLCYAANNMRGAPVQGEYYAYLRSLPNWREEVRLFWQSKETALLKPWYLAQKQPDDIIVTSSAEFLLRPLCERLHVRLVATRVNPRKGRLEGRDCHGAEKANRLRNEFPALHIEAFYSDSLTDQPLAELAQFAWLVKGDKRTPWPKR
jgi:hypothetical protein